MKKILEMEFQDSWNTYAMSAYNMIRNAGMWDRKKDYDDFIGETGISHQFIIHKKSSVVAPTYYDWKTEHNLFLQGIGIETQSAFIAPGCDEYETQHKTMIRQLKEAINAGVSATVWGIDTGEFGNVYGYDDADGVFYTRGVYGDQSYPVLYENIGRTFEPSPLLYFQYPLHANAKTDQEKFLHSMKYYIASMTGNEIDGSYVRGFHAYDAWIQAMSGEFDAFGLRYCVTVYCERKLAVVQYLKHYAKENTDLTELGLLVESFDRIGKEYYHLRQDVLEQGTEGPADLYHPVTGLMAKKTMELLKQIKEEEKNAVSIASRIVDLIALKQKDTHMDMKMDMKWDTKKDIVEGGHKDEL